VNFSTVAFIAEELNKNKISWAVGASVMLHFHGLVASPNDLDIIVHEDDIDKAKSVLSSIGQLTYDNSRGHNKVYLTKNFYKYKIRDIEMDVMAGFALKHNEGIYRFQFDSKKIVSYKDIEGIKIPLCSLEDWYVLYQLMENREPKVKMIEDYLIKNGVEHKNLLEQALKSQLPHFIIDRINKLICC
jgi:hypothetical protein